MTRDDDAVTADVVGRAAEEDADCESSRSPKGGTQRRWWVSDDVADRMERYFAENCSPR